MCVVDRRNDTAHAPAGGFAQVQKRLQNRMEAGSSDVDDFGSMPVDPASVSVGDEPSRRRKKDEPGGVAVVEGTPGPEALVQFILKRVWNIEATKHSLAADRLLV